MMLLLASVFLFWPELIFFGGIEIQTWAFWDRSANATSVLCRPLLSQNISNTRVRQQLYQLCRVHANNREVVGSIPIGCWAFFSFYPQLCVIKQAYQGGAALLFFCIKKCKPSCAACGETSLISTVWDLNNYNTNTSVDSAAPDMWYSFPSCTTDTWRCWCCRSWSTWEEKRNNFHPSMKCNLSIGWWTFSLRLRI